MSERVLEEICELAQPGAKNKCILIFHQCRNKKCEIKERVSLMKESLKSETEIQSCIHEPENWMSFLECLLVKFCYLGTSLHDLELLGCSECPESENNQFQSLPQDQNSDSMKGP